MQNYPIGWAAKEDKYKEDKNYFLNLDLSVEVHHSTCKLVSNTQLQKKLR